MYPPRLMFRRSLPSISPCVRASQLYAGFVHGGHHVFGVRATTLAFTLKGRTP
jgi:hypothetical protein